MEDGGDSQCITLANARDFGRLCPLAANFNARKHCDFSKMPAVIPSQDSHQFVDKKDRRFLGSQGSHHHLYQVFSYGNISLMKTNCRQPHRTCLQLPPRRSSGARKIRKQPVEKSFADVTLRLKTQGFIAGSKTCAKCQRSVGMCCATHGSALKDDPTCPAVPCVFWPS